MIYEEEGKVLKPNPTATSKLRQHRLTPACYIPPQKMKKKIKEYVVVEIKPTIFCIHGRCPLIIRLPAPTDTAV